jgi:FixJ family two-component response regulator
MSASGDPGVLRKVFLVDDEAQLRLALQRLLKAEGLDVETFASAAEFLARLSPDVAGCAILDLAMPEVDGIALQQRLAETGSNLSVVFLTGHGDIPTSVLAIKAGAVDFLTKPVKRDDLLRAVQAALARAGERLASLRATAELRARLLQLTPREREVLGHVITGRLNKVIASRLGTSEQTIKVHRGRVMEKLGVDSVADLVRVTQQLGVSPAPD